MSVVFILVFVAIVMAGGFLGAFIWSVKNGQYEDTYTPSVRILFDDPPMKENNELDEKKHENSSPESKAMNDNNMPEKETKNHSS